MLTSNDDIDMDKLVSIKGLIIRTTPIIPDMKDGEFFFFFGEYYIPC